MTNTLESWSQFRLKTMCIRVSKRECSQHLWTVTCALALAALITFVLLVAHRNVSAARARRSAPLVTMADDNPSPYAFTTRKLPSDDRFMCSVGNGHVATNIFSTTIYMNGLYNGERGRSHRARIPAWSNIRLNSTLTKGPGSRVSYTLDTRAGAFHVHVDRDWSTVHQRIYAHRYYTRAIVNQIAITAKHRTVIWRDHHTRFVELSYIPGPTSDDIHFDPPTLTKVENRVVWFSCGKTKEREDKKHQEELSTVCAYWTHAPTHLVVPRRGKLLHTFIMTVDSDKDVALKEMSDVLQERDDELYAKHTSEWKMLNDGGSIEIGGNLTLAKTINAIWYYYLSSLPSQNTNQLQGLYFGLSPGGLSRGALFEDYEGHNFWDTEMWIFPVVLMLQPQLAEILLRYRLAKAAVAAELAYVTGNRGIRYPWESAFTGQEVTQPCCPEVAEFEHHVTGCIAFAVRNYISTTGDDDWLKNGGCSMIMQMAEFWASRAVYNQSTGFYDIKNVMGPDEDHINVTNNAFTNVVAGYALYLGEYAICLCNFTQAERARIWARLAGGLVLPYDPILNYHPQFDGYKRSEIIKQADTVLLQFPLHYSMNQSTKGNDLEYYESVTRENGPAMTWSMHCIAHLRIGNSARAAGMLRKSYHGHIREPFKTWTEYRKPNIGAVNFFTGMGGFLQAIMFGYAGLNIRLDQLEIVKPQLPPDCTRLKIHGIKYLGSQLILDIHQSNTTLKVLAVDKTRPLILMIKNNQIPLTLGISVILYGDGPFVIRRNISNSCPLPLDLIGQFNYRDNEVYP